MLFLYNYVCVYIYILHTYKIHTDYLVIISVYEQNMHEHIHTFYNKVIYYIYLKLQLKLSEYNNFYITNVSSWLWIPSVRIIKSDYRNNNCEILIDTDTEQVVTDMK